MQKEAELYHLRFRAQGRIDKATVEMPGFGVVQPTKLAVCIAFEEEELVSLPDEIQASVVKSHPSH